MNTGSVCGGAYQRDSLQCGEQELGHLSPLPEYQFKVRDVYGIYILYYVFEWLC